MPGDSLMIPGGMRHNETGTADELELLEVSVPGGDEDRGLRSAGRQA